MVDFFPEELRFGPHPACMASADRGPRRYARTEMLGQRAQQLPTASCHALIRSLAVVEDTRGQIIVKPARASPSPSAFGMHGRFVVACQASRLVGCSLAKAVTSCSAGMVNFSSSSPKAGE